VARHKDSNWNLPEGKPNPTGGSTHSWESIHAAILMDIRDELKELNRTLNCHRVPAGMDALVRIDRRIAKNMPLRVRRKK
jgi:hypothetical protein